MTIQVPQIFFFNDTATTEIYTLSLHDALPISGRWRGRDQGRRLDRDRDEGKEGPRRRRGDRKSTRLNSSHGYISYAVFCFNKNKAVENQSEFCDAPVVRHVCFFLCALLV